MRTPFPGGDALRFDIAERGRGEGWGGKKDGEANDGRDERESERVVPATARSLGSNSAQTTFRRLDRVQGVHCSDSMKRDDNPAKKSRVRQDTRATLVEEHVASAANIRAKYRHSNTAATWSPASVNVV